MNNAADLIDAVAGFAWPAAFLIVFLIYREEVTGLIRRVRRGKGPGFEFEFDEALDELKESADVAARSVPPEPVIVTVGPPRPAPDDAGAEPRADEPDVRGRENPPIDGSSRTTHTGSTSARAFTAWGSRRATAIEPSPSGSIRPRRPILRRGSRSPGSGVSIRRGRSRGIATPRRVRSSTRGPARPSSSEETLTRSRPSRT